MRWQIKYPVMLLAIAAFVTGLFWAKARDPFKRIEYSLKTASGTKFRVMVVLPKPAGKRPVAVYLHSLGGNLASDGNDLRLIAGQGLAAVGVEYAQTNRPQFDEELIALKKFLDRQAWAKADAVAWVGYSQGAVMGLKSLLRHPEVQPQLFVRWEGNWVPELDSFPVSTLHCSFVLIHGEDDERFPVADCRRLAELLRTNGVPVMLRVFPGHSHRFGADQPVVLKGIAEYCANFFGSVRPEPVNVRPLLWYYWLPVGLLAIIIAAQAYSRWRIAVKVTPDSRPRITMALIVIAWVLGLAALAETGIHLVVPRLNASPGTLDVARRWLVRPESRADFDWLVQQPGLSGQKIGTLSEHLELAGLQRNLFFPRLEDEMYRDYILSPRIGNGGNNEIQWRRALWENFYPSMRNDSDPAVAAQTIVRLLRERVTIVPGHVESGGVGEIWKTGVADADGFEMLYVAVLRSVGIPARLNSARQVGFWDGRAWTPAPQPLIGTRKDLVIE